MSKQPEEVTKRADAILKSWKQRSSGCYAADSYVHADLANALARIELLEEALADANANIHELDRRTFGLVRCR